MVREWYVEQDEVRLEVGWKWQWQWQGRFGQGWLRACMVDDLTWGMMDI